MKNIWQKCCGIILMMLIIVAASTPQAATGTSLETLRQEQGEIQSSIRDTRKQLQNTVVEKNKLLGDLTQINEEINVAELLIENLNAQIVVAQANIAATEAEIARKQADYDGRMEIFSQRLKEIYQYGDVDYLEVLLKSNNFSEFLTRFEYLSYIADNDSKLLDEVVALKEALEAERDVLVAQKNELENIRAEQVAKTEELNAISAQKRVLIGELEAQQSSMYDMLAALEEESNKIAAQIVSLQRPAGKAPSAGSLVWPAPASYVVTSPYGQRIHPVRKTKAMHTGIDIGAGYGTPCVAAAAGTVLFSGYNGGYGNYVIIDHGGGMSTLYGHLASSSVRAGSAVSAGATIGRIGSTGVSTGPHLHFEVRLNGAHTNPAPYLGI